MRRTSPSRSLPHRPDLLAAAAAWLVALAILSGLEPPGAAQELSPAPACTGTVVPAQPGPWGALEYYHFFLEPSASVMGKTALPGPALEWSFVGLDTAGVGAMLDITDLRPDQRQQLMAALQPRPGGGSIVRPSAELVASLSSTARGQIYRVLGQWQENEFLANPVTIPQVNLGCWFEGSGLSPGTESQLRSLLFRRGDTWLFADVPLLVRSLQSREERLRLTGVLYRERTLVLRLRVSQTADLTEVAHYWNGGGKSRDTLSLLESIARTPGVDTLDIVHLLPPLARRYLYAYPTRAEVSNDLLPDCHWTSFNFFNAQPEDRFFKPEVVAETLQHLYRPVSPPYQFGDVLMFCHEGRPGFCEHSTVFIAADIVYTKNGRHPTEPWILMTLEDLLSRYSYIDDLMIQGYRRR